MTSVGAHLRALRERRGASLGEIARTTRVATRYLEALEADAFDALPSSVFTRGFIRAYCQALDEPPEEALASYDAREGRPPQPVTRPVPPLPRPGRGEPRTRGTVVASLVLLVVLGVALFTVSLVIQPHAGKDRAATGGSAESRPTPLPGATPAIPESGPAPAPSVDPPHSVSAPTVPPPAEPEASAPPRPAVPPTQTAAPDPQGATGPAESPQYRLVARTSEVTWIRVRTGDGRSSEENVPAGEVREWVSERPFVLTIGNAGGVTFELNGRPLPPLGGSGAVIPRLVLPAESR